MRLLWRKCIGEEGGPITKVEKVDKVDDLMEKVNNLVLRWKRDKVECGKGVEFFC